MLSKILRSPDVPQFTLVKTIPAEHPLKAISLRI